jgi:hypothetical protein
MSETQLVNLFLEHDESTGNYVDADKFKQYVIIDNPEENDYLGKLDRTAVSDAQKAALSMIRHKSEVEHYDVNIEIPIYLANCASVLIRKHSAKQFSDHVVLYNHDLIDFFLKGVMNDHVKTLFEYNENGNRKYMIFISLSHENVRDSSLSMLKIRPKSMLAMQIEANNRRIRNKFFDSNTKKHIEMLDHIALSKHEFTFREVGYIKVIIAPNFVLNYFSSIDSHGIKYHLCIDVVNNPGERNEERIRKMLPLSVVSVNKESYDQFKNSSSFDFNSLFIIDGADDRNEQLKSNPNMLIGIIPREHNETVVIPVESTKDHITLSIVVSYLDKYAIFNDDMPIQVGKILHSMKKIAEYTKSAVGLFKTKLFGHQSIDDFIGTSDDPNLNHGASFNKLYGDNFQMESRFPVCTPIHVSDLKLYNELDFISVHEGKRSSLRPVIFHNDGSNAFTSPDRSLGIMNHHLSPNGRVWIDRYWRVHNKISKEIFNKWIMLFAELSTYARQSIEDIYKHRDMTAPPPGMSETIFKNVKHSFRVVTGDMWIKYVKFKIFYDYLAAMSVNNVFSFNIFLPASVIIKMVENAIENNPDIQKIYVREHERFNIRTMISTECENEVSLSIVKPRPADIIFTNFTVSINFDSFSQFLNEFQLPSKIKSYIQPAFDMISLFRNGEMTTMEIELDDEVTSQTPSSSSSSTPRLPSSKREAYTVFYEEGAVDLISGKKLKIISLKNLKK